MKPLFGAYWSEEEVKLMKQFDNSSLKELFLDYDILAKDMREKYNSRAAAFRLKQTEAFLKGESFDEPRPPRNVKEVLVHVEHNYNKCASKQKELEKDITDNNFIKKATSYFDEQARFVDKELKENQKLKKIEDFFGRIGKKVSENLNPN